MNRINSGWLEVICGCMFSGKTEEVIRRLRRAQIAKMSTIIFKPKIDYRYSESEIVSHNKNRMNSKIIKKLSDLSAVNKIILPGVGSFDYVMDTFIKSGLREAVQDKVLCNKIFNTKKQVFMSLGMVDWKNLGLPYKYSNLIYFDCIAH